jgi:hypothetical protein
MKWMGALAFAAVTVASAVGIRAGQTDCADVSRRSAAIALARTINTAEMAAYRGQRSYSQLGDLPVGQTPTRMTVQLSTDGETYAFSIKDDDDACHGAIFSDQTGVIYAGAPIR